MTATMTTTSTARGFTLFETTIGTCGIAWGPDGVVGIQLPEREASETRRRLGRRFPNAQEAAPPAEVQEALDGIVALLRGESADLTSVILDMGRVPPFNRRVYEVARTIPPPRLSAAAVADALDGLLRSPGVLSRCHELTTRFSGVDVVGDTCRQIEELAHAGQVRAA